MRNLEIYADSIAPNQGLIESLIRQGITGCTINPTLAKNECVYLPFSEEDAAIPIYERYAKFLIEAFSPHPVSVQVLSGDMDEMYQQALTISSWGENVYVKIPVITPQGKSCAPLIVDLLDKGIKINVTALFTVRQVTELMAAGLIPEHDCILSVFCGRIANTGLLPQNTVSMIRDVIGHNTRNKLLWAGVRSAMDISLAREHCDIITVPQAVLDKLPMVGKDLSEYCLETVRMFANDAKNFTI